VGNVLALAASAVTTLFEAPIVSAVLGNRVGAVTNAVVDRLRTLASAGEPSHQVDLAYATWWACLQAAVTACNRMLIQRGNPGSKIFSALENRRGMRNPEEAPVRVLRDRLLNEIGSLERDRGPYFQGLRSLVDDPEVHVSVAADADGGELAAALFQPWLENCLVEIREDLGATFALTSADLLSGEQFDKDIQLFLGECLKRDQAVRDAYQAVALISQHTSLSTDPATGALPSAEAVAADLGERFSELGRELLERASASVTALEATIRMQTSLVISSRDELEQVADELRRSEERRRDAEDLAIAAAGRNTRVLVERRVQELAEAPLVGREPIFRDLERIARSEQGRSVVIAAPAGYGKSALLAHWLREAAPWWGHVAYHFVDASQGPETSQRRKLFGNLLGQMLPYYGLKLDPQVDAESRVGHLLEGKGASLAPDERLIVLIDGLDEVLDWDGGGPMLLQDEQLPPGTIVIATIRADADAEEQLLENWRHDEVLRLGGLSEADVAAAIAASAKPAVAALADDPAVVRHVAEVTSGVPLYIRFAIEAIGDRVDHGHAPVENPAAPDQRGAVPADAARLFGTFLHKHFVQLHREIPGLEKTAAYRLLLYLVAARMPLYRQDVSALRVDTLAASNRRVTRWIEEPSDGVYALPHPFLGEALARALDAVDDAATELRKLAEAWKTKPTPFAARSLVALAANDPQSLIALGANRRFLDMQAEMVTDDPLLPTRTVEAALGAAVAEADVETIIQLSLLGQEVKAGLESPAAALKSGASTARVLGLFQSKSDEDQLLWAPYLTLALPENAVAERQKLDRWTKDSAAARGRETRSRAGVDQINRILIHLLTERQAFALAVDLARSTRANVRRARALADVAGAVARHGNPAWAHQLAALARETMLATVDGPVRWADLMAVVVMLRDAGLPDEARVALRDAHELIVQGERPEPPPTYPWSNPSDYEEHPEKPHTPDAAAIAIELGEGAIARDIARRVLRWARKDERPSLALARAARTCADAGDIQRATDAATSALRTPDVTWIARATAANALAHAGASADARRAARRAFEEVRAASPQSWDQLSSRLSRIADLVRDVLPEEARQATLDAVQLTLEHAQQQPKTKRLRELSELLAKLGDVEAARRALDEACASAGPPGYHLSEYEQGANAVAMARLGHITDALELAWEITLDDARISALTTVAQILATMTPPDPRALGIAGELFEAVTTGQEHRQRATVLTRLSEAFARAGVPQAMALASAVRSRSYPAAALATVARQLANAGAIESAAEAAALAEARMQAEDKIDDRALRALVATYMTLGDVDAALRTAGSSWKSRRSEALLEVARRLSSDDPERAALILDEALAELPPASGPIFAPSSGAVIQFGNEDAVIRVMAHALAADVCMRIGRREQALQLCDIVFTEDSYLHQELSSGEAVLDLWAGVHAEAAAIDLALNQIETMDDRYLRCRALSSLSLAATDVSGKEAGAVIARRAARMARKLDGRATAMAAPKIALAAARAGEHEIARSFIDRVLHDTDGQEEHPRPHRAAIVGPLAEIGDVEGARSAAMDAVRGLSDKVSLEQGTDSVAVAVVETLVEHDLAGDAEVVIESVDDLWLRTEATAALAKSLAIAGHRREAVAAAIRGISHLS
jgi:tetratricopeptide (TPR) repeat protein